MGSNHRSLPIVNPTNLRILKVAFGKEEISEPRSEIKTLERLKMSLHEIADVVSPQTGLEFHLLLFRKASTATRLPLQLLFDRSIAATPYSP